MHCTQVRGRTNIDNNSDILVQKYFTMSNFVYFLRRKFPPRSPSHHPPTPKGDGKSLTETLLSTISAADNKTQKATLMFQATACALDGALDENTKLLPPHLQKYFIYFITDLGSVAQKHFESHVRGSQKPPKPYSSSNYISTATSSPSE